MMNGRATDPGIVYFADDDNTYDVELFAELRKTRRISMFPVGLIHPSGVSSPVLNDRGRVTGKTPHIFRLCCGLCYNTVFLSNKNDFM